MKTTTILLMSFLAIIPAASAADEKTAEPKAATSSSPFGGPAHGGMTYSPTEGWIKTGKNQVKAGTDDLVYANKQAAQEEARKKMADDLAKMNELKAAKEKAWEDVRKAEEARKAKKDAIKSAGKKEAAEKKKGKRVLVG